MQATRFSVPACLCLFASSSCSTAGETRRPRSRTRLRRRAAPKKLLQPARTPPAARASPRAAAVDLRRTAVRGRSWQRRHFGRRRLSTAGKRQAEPQAPSIGGALAGDGGTATNSDGEQLELCVRLRRRRVTPLPSPALIRQPVFRLPSDWVVALGTADLARSRTVCFRSTTRSGCTGTPPCLHLRVGLRHASRCHAVMSRC